MAFEDQNRRRVRPHPVTIREVAAYAGVAPMTVSRALKQPELVAEATRHRVLEAVAATGFIPNRMAGSLSTTSTPIVAAVVTTIANSIMAETVEGLSDGLAGSRFELFLAQSHFDAKSEEMIVQAALGWRPAGLVLVGMTHTRRTRQLLKRAGIPVVELNEIDSRPIDIAVGLSNRAGGHACARHLIERGRRHIGLVLGESHQNERLRRRADGFLKALREADLPCDLEQVVDAGITARAGREGLVQLLERYPDLDGCAFGSETAAIGALQLCIRRGIDVPGELAIMGWGDNELSSQIVPALPSLRTPRYRIGRTAAEALLDRIGGRSLATNLIDLGFEIVVRDST